MPPPGFWMELWSFQVSHLYRWLREEANKGRWLYAGDGHLVLVQGLMPADREIMERQWEYIRQMACE